MRISIKLLKTIAAFTSTDVTRYAIQYVRIEPTEGGNILVATDGRKLVAHKVESEPLPEPAYFYRGDVCKLIGAEVSIGVLDGRTLVQCFDKEGQESLSFWTRPETSIRFPEWRKVVPQKIGAVRGHFDPKHLVPFKRLSELLTGFDSHISTFATDELAGHAVFNERQFLGLVMPLRLGGNQTKPSLPDWLKEVSNA